ncbi:hypothetical protein CW362_09525 [Streptomyces populi]|uniref:DUF4232 domain-containing protein n=1 Tax=Streptomyces populi TaxID=2058924 RepID=A0A2I0STJ5_9ACTN|nr:DUF4232 domain-containing protein [Streptomyces populi]PKT73251.1 hypothetical protein CW362_09525 [Streptomyces populi]
MSTIRNRTVFLAVTATAVLGLAAIACGSEGSGARASGQEATSSPLAASSAASTRDAGSAEDSGTAGGSAGATPTGSGSGQDAVSGSGSDTGSASGSTPACTTKDVAISAARKDGPPYTHIVLTARNTSGHSCRMNGFPEIQFLEGHRENVPAVAKSKPAAPVVLAAGAPAYALVRLSDGGKDEDTEPVIAFSVTVQGSGAAATVRAPGAEGVAVDSAKWATGYWTPELRNGADDF